MNQIKLKPYKIIVNSIYLLFLLSNTYTQTPSNQIPPFRFCTLDNTSFTNKDLFLGKMTLIIFFDVTCDHCKQAIKVLNDRYKECDKLAIYLISLDSKFEIRLFLNQNGSNLMDKKNVTILQDCNNEFIRDFGPRKYPSIFIYSTEQKLQLYDDEDLNLESFSKL